MKTIDLRRPEVRLMDASRRVQDTRNEQGVRRWYEAVFGKTVGRVLADEHIRRWAS